MNNIDRLEEYKDIDFDRLLRDIQTGKVKSGKYSNLVKVKRKYNEKENKDGSKDNNKFK